MKNIAPKQESRFTDLGLSEDLITVLTRLNFVTPTPIQRKAIPEALKGTDVIGIAQTGTGKTLAFFLPMLQRIKDSKETGLIVVPTRELAFQVQEEIDRVGGRLGFKTALLIGGANIQRQIRSLKKGPHIVVGTPGRIIDHISRRTVKLDQVAVLVLDEADRMLDMGFAPQINEILKAVPDKRQTLLFSATMPPDVAKIAHNYMVDPVRIEVAKAGTSAKNIKQGICYVEGRDKFDLLKELLKEFKDGPVLVFCRTKHGTKKMARVLQKEGFNTDELHSNRTLNQRRRALENFKTGKSRIMIATDVAARGIDVKEIELVVNYDLPDKMDDYVHRIGRTGRAGHKGQAISFVTPEEFRDVRLIERMIGARITVLESENTLSEAEVFKMGRRPIPKQRRGSRSGGRSGGRSGSTPRYARGGKNSRSSHTYGSERPKRKTYGNGGGTRRSQSKSRSRSRVA